MERERVQESIKRVKAGSSNDSAYDIAAAFMGDEQWSVADYRNALVELLETVCDSVPLPKDAEGEALRLGDFVKVAYKDDKEVLSVRYIHLSIDHDGQASRPVWTIGVGIGEEYFTRAVMPSAFVHYHKSTVDDVIREFEDEWNYVVDNGDENVMAALIIDSAEKLREVMDA